MRWIGVVAAVLLAAALVYLFRVRTKVGDDPGRERTALSPLGDSPSSLPPRAGAVPSPRVAVTSSPDGAQDLAPGSGGEPGDAAAGAYPVDLERLRAKLPENLYWQLGEPTQDPQVLQMRAEEEARWNELYGKVQSSTASEEEIHRYYDHRRQLSEDYLAFSSLVLEEYGEKLPERDRGLYELSIKMHRTRLSEIPRQTEEALARKDAHGKRREEWQKGGQGP